MIVAAIHPSRSRGSQRALVHCMASRVGRPRAIAVRAAAAGLIRGLPGTSASMAMAISCSPMMTVVAPCFFRCSVSSSECERAMMRQRRVDRPAPAPPSARPRTHREWRRAGSAPPARLAASITSGLAALPWITSMPASRAWQTSGPDLLDQQHGQPLRLEAVADDATDAAVADQHDMVGELRSAGSARAQACSAAAFGLGRGGDGLAPSRQIPVEAGEQHGIEQDRDDGAGQDQVAAALRQQARGSRRGRPG